MGDGVGREQNGKKERAHITHPRMKKRTRFRVAIVTSGVGQLWDDPKPGGQQ